MLIAKAILIVFINLIIYYLLGSLFVLKKDKPQSVILKMGVGFFAYYGLFCLVCLPVMFTYYPLSDLAGIWGIVCLALAIISIILKGKMMIGDFKDAAETLKKNPVCVVIIFLLVIFQVVTVVMSYDFTLDAAYYVANVATSVDTNSINIYDPFTGAWQDHFELRYAFATYSINDAVVCRIASIPALVETKTVMSSTVMIMVNLVYLGIAESLFKKNAKKVTIMMAVVMWINYTFITIYTASNFLITRTYEGKAIVGNLTLILIFWMFIKLVEDDAPTLFWIMMFFVSFGSTTISSSANMLVPAELSVLLVPYIIKNKKWDIIPKYVVCLLPGIIMMLEYVLYVKGYFSIYTYKWN